MEAGKRLFYGAREIILDFKVIKIMNLIMTRRKNARMEETISGAYNSTKSDRNQFSLGKFDTIIHLVHFQQPLQNILTFCTLQLIENRQKKSFFMQKMLEICVRNLKFCALFPSHENCDEIFQLLNRKPICGWCHRTHETRTEYEVKLFRHIQFFSPYPPTLSSQRNYP